MQTVVPADMKRRFWELLHCAIPDSFPRVHARLPSGIDSMRQVLGWVARNQHFAVYSFDLFDTVVRRRIDPPELVKELAARHVADILAQSGVRLEADTLLAQRNKSEDALRHLAVAGGRDPQCRLDEVIEHMLKALALEQTVSVKQAVEYEMDLEKAATEPMPGIQEVLEYLCSLGKRAICVSESYLSLGQVKALLEHHRLLQFFDAVYVSSDLGMSKATGNLYRHVLRAEGSSLVHVGDDYVLDARMPRVAGLKSLWFHDRREERRKKRLRRLRAGGDRLKYVNEIVSLHHKHADPLYKVGYELFGPALTVFVHNVAEQARRDGVEALFFVARDGYVMKKIYDQLSVTVYEKHTMPISRYFCLGRIPVRLASLRTFGEREVMEVLRYTKKSGKGATLADALVGYGLLPAHFAATAAACGFDLTAPVDSLGESRLEEFFAGEEFARKVTLESGQARSLLRQYLFDIGFMGRKHVAVVDSNAEGVTQILLDRSFEHDSSYPAVNRYYFNLVNLGPNKIDLNPDT
ncbi:MAG: HAD-IA family hydrolase, partial [Dehalococcoidia bacterium]|nr:HAD-IA family hydrolase [Dehalococcoidia bacterium]